MCYCFVTLSYSCAAFVKRAKWAGFLPTQSTIQAQTACPGESHLISSSLHVINLPPQCYCSPGHSSSFTGRSIDQTSFCNAFICENGKRKNKTVRCIQHMLSLLCTLCVCHCIRMKSEGVYCRGIKKYNTSVSILLPMVVKLSYLDLVLRLESRMRPYLNIPAYIWHKQNQHQWKSKGRVETYAISLAVFIYLYNQ